jgi:glutathione S-transferase
VIEVHVFPPAWGINPSPFCQKVETYCRLAGIAYRPVVTLPLRAPRGKLPFIVEDGRRIPDSGAIIAHLAGRDPARDLDAGLDARQRARGHLLRRTCEESLYFVMLYARWIDPAGWAATRPVFFGGMPPGLSGIVAPLVRRAMARSLRAQGTGRRPRDEVYAFGAADLAAISVCLEETPFAVADRPTSLDATLYAFLVNIIRPPIEIPLKATALAHAALVEYTARMERAVAERGAPGGGAG